MDFTESEKRTLINGVSILLRMYQLNCDYCGQSYDTAIIKRYNTIIYKLECVADV